MATTKECAMEHLDEIRKVLRTAGTNQHREEFTTKLNSVQIQRSRSVEERMVNSETAALLLKSAVEELLKLVKDLTRDMDPFSDEYAKIEGRTSKARDALLKVDDLFMMKKDGSLDKESPISTR